MRAMSFFFQAEDGIRDLTVTGVQTCALPIYRPLLSAALPTKSDAPGGRPSAPPPNGGDAGAEVACSFSVLAGGPRSGERRGGEGGRIRGGPDQLKKKTPSGARTGRSTCEPSD